VSLPRDLNAPASWREPFATSETVHRKMSRQLRRNTAPEMAVRRELHRQGLRYFVHRRPLKDLRREADVVFPTQRVAVFIDGCFWHGCPEHGTSPASNRWYWPEKIERNRARDRDTDFKLGEAGWAVVRIWEHEVPSSAARRVAHTVKSRRSSSYAKSAQGTSDADRSR
jgi:DNA mismatch endonuclease, patch repair protein